ncbi:hypothetical protein F5Y01DRAFT_277661 [Xylaria sp. FL0043]|nr:hypothetical protein F5Y01DRAFT_277661 [Xylaria sp. FL0043]
MMPTNDVSWIFLLSTWSSQDLGYMLLGVRLALCVSSTLRTAACGRKFEGLCSSLTFVLGVNQTAFGASLPGNCRKQHGYIS